MISLTGFTRRRKALAAAFLPYLLLSVLVDFVHLHRLIAGPVAAASVTEHVKPSEPTNPRIPDASCAICQWIRAGTGLQPAVSTPVAQARVSTAVIASVASTVPPLDLGSPDFRGPPSPLSV